MRHPTLLTLALSLAAAGCIESRLDGLECLSDGDCAAGQICEVTAAACRPAPLDAKGGPDGGQPGLPADRFDLGAPDMEAAPDLFPDLEPDPDPDPVGSPFGPWCTLYGRVAPWPDVVVLVPSQHEASAPSGVVIEEAVDAMHGELTVARCDVTEGVRRALAGHGDRAPPIVIGPIAFDDRMLRVAEAIARPALWVRPDPLPRMQAGWWSVHPAPVDLVPALVPLLGELPARAAVVTRAGPIGDALADLLADALCPDDGPCFDHRRDSSPALFGDAEWVVTESQSQHSANMVACALDAQLDTPPQVLMLDGPIAPVDYLELWETGQPCGGRIDPAALCHLRGLTTAGPRAGDAGGAFDRSRSAGARDARLRGALRLADLARRIAARDAAPGEVPSRDALDAAMGALLTPGDGASLVLDGDGWREVARRIEDGEPLPRLLGEAANAIPDPETRRPVVERLWLRRYTVGGGVPVVGEDALVYAADAPVEPAVFEALFEAEGCVARE